MDRYTLSIWREAANHAHAGDVGQWRTTILYAARQRPSRWNTYAHMAFLRCLPPPNYIANIGVGMADLEDELQGVLAAHAAAFPAATPFTFYIKQEEVTDEASRKLLNNLIRRKRNYFPWADFPAWNQMTPDQFDEM